MFEHLYPEQPEPIFSDEYIDAWAHVYLANPWIRARGVLFETFLLDPTLILCALGAPAPYCRRMLLLTERAVRWRIDLLDAIERGAPRDRALEELENGGARCENGRIVEKMRHHARPHRTRGFFPERRP